MKNTMDPQRGGLPTSRCPECGAEADSATGIGNNESPSCGDLSVCVECGAWLEFTEILTVKRLSPEVRQSLDKEAIAVMILATKFIKERNQKQ